MAEIKAQADKVTSSSKVKYSMFIGRWQPWHPGHRWLIDQRLSMGKRVLLCVRDVPVDEQNPFPTEKVVENLNRDLKDLIDSGMLKILVIPDIESVNYGRGVGYDIIEHVPPQQVSSISATKIREQMKKDGAI